jgi:hypothetical protein
VQVKHRYGPCRVGLVARELGADHTSRLQPETVAVERERATKVADCQGDHMYARPHLYLLCAGYGVCLHSET